MLAEYQIGRLVCEKLGISILELAKFCHSGKLTAYCFEDRHRVLASSQCNTKFKHLANTSFTVRPSAKDGILAIGKDSTENFGIYIDGKSEEHEGNGHDLSYENPLHEKLFNESTRLESFQRSCVREIIIKHCSSEYIIYYNLTTVNPLVKPSSGHYVWLYANNKIFFELTENTNTIGISFLEMKSSNKGEIKRGTAKLSIEAIQDSAGNKKFVIADYDKNKIYIQTSPFICAECGIHVDRNRLKFDDEYIQLYESCRAFLHQYAVDYFTKDDLSYLRPLKHEDDFFIFDYDQYRNRFHFLETEEDTRKNFFHFIERLVFNEKEIQRVMAYNITIDAIQREPKKYMIDQCSRLESQYSDISEKLIIIRAYRMALEGSSWKNIHSELWQEREQNLSLNDKFISDKLKNFKKIAILNNLPFINAKKLRDMKGSEKKSIVEDMLKQISRFHEGENAGRKNSDE